MKLTAKFVENVSEAGKYYDQHGLFLHVRPSGAKKWLQRYTFQGRRREIGLGSAKIISVATARKNAHQNLVLVSEGIDPIEDKKQDSIIPTFEVAARKVYEDNHLKALNDAHVKMFVSGMSAKARGYNDNLLEGYNASFAMPDKLIECSLEADVVLCY